MKQEERLTWGLVQCLEPVIGVAGLHKIKQGLANTQARVENFWRAPREFRQWLGPDERKLAAVEEVAKSWTTEKLAAHLERQGVKIVVLGEADYPLLLRYIPDYATALFYQGELAVTAKPTLAVVGSRRVTDDGRAAVRYLLDTSLQKLTIVSGLMTGVDCIAHERALEIGAATVAVLGYGMDMTWPREMRELRARIAGGGGLVLSEFAPWSEPLGRRFPQRNRLVAGLSVATLVVEAAAKSGSLITANLALDYGREVLAVPGSIFSENAWGCNELLRQGAALVARPEMIRETILASKVNNLPAGYYRELEEDWRGAAGQGREASLARPRHGGAAPSKRRREFSDPVQNQVFQLLVRENLTLEHLCEKLTASLAEVMSATSMLELAGEIEQANNGEWTISR